MNLKVYIINSAPGVGKSTSLKLLENLLGEDSAFIDGDDFARVIPLNNTVEWLNLVQDNIACCVSNFFKYDYKNVLISFVFPTDERIKRLKNLIEGKGIKVSHVKLLCSKEILKDRLVNRNSQKIISIKRALEINEMIENLESDYSIKTSNKRPLEVAKKISAIINKKE